MDSVSRSEKITLALDIFCGKANVPGMDIFVCYRLFRPERGLPSGSKLEEEHGVCLKEVSGFLVVSL